MTWAELVFLWLAWIVAGGSPGPANLAIAGTSMQIGRKAGLCFSLGVLSGSTFWGLMAALGMGALMMTHVWIFEILRYSGAAYLLFLAIKSLRSALKTGIAGAGNAHTGTSLQIFGKGMLLHLTNPKAILSWGAVYAIVIPADAGISGALGLWAFLLTGSALVFIGYAFLFSSPAMVKAYVKMRRGFEFTFAALFGAAAFKIFTTRLVG